MADFLQKLWGQKPLAADPSPSPTPAEDDFADFSSAAEPTPASFFSEAVSSVAGAIPSETGIAGNPALPRPFTKWYRVWERVYWSDFYTEAFIVPFIILVVGFHLWGSRKNRRKAKGWIVAHAPVLHQEFASVGFSGRPTTTIEIGGSETTIPSGLLQAKSATEYISYATGRQNVAFIDLKLTLAKRYNPINRFTEQTLAFFIESIQAPTERMEATSYVFDGRESSLVPYVAESKEVFKSTYDGFVWAVVHKESMKTLRDGRYDLSLTSTKDHPKLPVWATVMSEAAEITDTLLTPELIKAIESAGEALEALIISDQSIDQPKTMNEAQPKKRISLSLKLPKGTSAAAHEPALPLFKYFLRMADFLVNNGKFRPEAMRRVKATRDEEIKKIKRVDDTEKAEERRLKAEKDKKMERDNKLKAMTPEQQRKFLDKERSSELKKSMRSRTVRS